ncbi:hypothetical protein DV735_g1461, partial [Chaetothyriales sp. CBS 134920]
LHRLRPEFELAVRTAVAWHLRDDRPAGEGNDSAILDQVITIHDLTTTLSSSPLASPFTPTAKSAAPPVPVVLVDHNVPSILGFTADELSKRLTVAGCLDHHVDESSDPATQSYTPRIISLDAGSCTSLVISYLRSQNLFPDPDPNEAAASLTRLALRQISSLALSAILIDTNNLKSASKTKPIDLEAVEFLTSHLTKPSAARDDGVVFTPPSFFNSTSSSSASSTFFTTDYHALLSTAKVHSLENLTSDEILDRDYKQWAEPTSNRSNNATTTPTPTAFVQIGISSSPQPISWLGLLAVAFTPRGAAVLERFEQRAGAALGLEEYDDYDDGGEEKEQQQQQQLTEALNEAEFKYKEAAGPPS